MEFDVLRRGDPIIQYGDRNKIEMKHNERPVDVKELLQQELQDYLASRNFKNSLKEALNDAVEDAVKPLRDEIGQLKKELAEVREKANDNEQYSRRCKIQQVATTILCWRPLSFNSLFKA